MFDPCTWTEACSVPMLRFLQPVAVPQTRPSVPGHSQAVVCRQKNERQIMRERGADSEWCKWYRAMGIVQGGGKKNIPARASLNGSVWNWFLPVSLSFIFILIYLSTCVLPFFPLLFLCSDSTSTFCPLLNRPETRLEQAESQWQWHSQRPDSGWVQTDM